MNPALQYSRTQSGQIENLLEAKNSSISAVEISSNNSPYSGCFHVKPVSNNKSPKLRRPNSRLERCLFSQSHKEEKHHPNRQSTYDTEESSNGRRIPASLVRCLIDYYNITKVNRALRLVSQPLPFVRGCTPQNFFLLLLLRFNGSK